MNKWRPDGWKNPHQGLPTDEIFEAGADAMLEALKEKGAYMTPEQMKILAPERKYPYGYLVFIPEEELSREMRMKILKVGELVEHSDGRIDISKWILDGNWEGLDAIDLAVKVFQQELIAAAKRVGTYTYQED